MDDQNGNAPLSEKAGAVVYACKTLVGRNLRWVIAISGMLFLGFTVKSMEDQKYEKLLDDQLVQQRRELAQACDSRAEQVANQTSDQLLQRDSRIGEQVQMISDLRNVVEDLNITVQGIMKRQEYQIAQRKKEVVVIQKAADKATDAASIATKGVSEGDRQEINQAARGEVKK